MYCFALCYYISNVRDLFGRGDSENFVVEYFLVARPIIVSPDSCGDLGSLYHDVTPSTYRIKYVKSQKHTDHN